MTLVSRRGANARLLTFAFLLTFLSSFGQTFFIGLFSAELRAGAGLEAGSFGTLYSAATLVSAFGLYWAGAVIDRVPLPLYVTGPVLLLGLGCLTLALGDGVVWLAVGLFLLRFAGQGLLSHTAVISIARVFERARGRALAVALFGHAAGEAVLPPLAVAGIVALGWRSVWALAVLALAVALPLLVALGRRGPEESPAAAPGPAEALRHATRLDVVRDPRFYRFLPALLLPGFVITGTFLHQSQLLHEKGWPTSWYAAAFSAYAAAHVAGTVASGLLIDRYSARRVLPYYLLPLAAACLAIALSEVRLVLLPFMAGAGATAGISATTGTALWAELYGPTHLGAIRALSATIMVVATALAPAIFGALIEIDISMNAILFACAVASLGAMLLAWFD